MKQNRTLPNWRGFSGPWENEERLVDLLVIDEAHHMRNPETQTNRLGQLMRNVSEYLVLLTATPIHNHNYDIFSPTPSP